MLAEWDQLMASFEDFAGPINLYSNVDPDAKLRKTADDCEVKSINYRLKFIRIQFYINVLKTPKQQIRLIKNIAKTFSMDLKIQGTTCT